MSPSRRLLLSLGVVASFLAYFAADSVRGQGGVQQLGNSLTIESELKKNRYVLNRMMEYKETKEKITPDVLDNAAKFYVYRVTWPAILEAKIPEKGDTEIVRVVHDFNKHIDSVVAKTRSGEDMEFVNAYSPILVTAFRQVTDLPVVENAKAIVHCTDMMPALAKLRHDSVSKYLVELLDPKTGKHDLIKLGAIRALREFMPVDPWADPIQPNDEQNKPKLERRAGDLERIDALTKFILRPAPTSASPDELEAYRYLRREAIETLALAGAPAVAAYRVGGKSREITGPVAPLLMRICMGNAAGENKLVPEPSLAERNEAALGLCNMVVWYRANANGATLQKMNPHFDPNPTYYFIGQTLLDLGREYSNNFGDIAGAGEKKVPTTLPWKYTGKRWDVALERLVKNVPSGDKQATAQAKGIFDDGKSLAKAFQEANPKTNINVNVLQYLGKNPPPREFLIYKSQLKSPPIQWDGK